MANENDTANPTRRRRNQPKHTAEPLTVATASDFTPPRLPPPQTLEEAIERVRSLVIEVRAMLHCLSGVLQYSDDNDGVMHAEVADAAARWVNDSAADLDMVKLRPLIEASRQGRGGSSNNDGSHGGASNYPNQVREPTPAYHV